MKTARTSKCCASFHAKFDNLFYSTHRSVYLFFDRCVKSQSSHIPIKRKDTVKTKLEVLAGLYMNIYWGNKLDALG